LFIGPPGMMKSPAMMEALKPLHHLEAEAAKDYEVARKAYEADIDAFKLRKSVKSSLDKEALRGSHGIGGQKAVVTFDLGEEPEEPHLLRYRTNDSTYEAIGELLVVNPTGILVERDELISLLRYLDREEFAVARGFYLSGWSGTQPYTFDRIGRGHRHVDAVCISIVGNTQPSRVAEYIRRANADGAGGDGLIQRFGLMVWPDSPGEWRNVDRYPDVAAREAVWKVSDCRRRSDGHDGTIRGDEGPLRQASVSSFQRGCSGGIPVVARGPGAAATRGRPLAGIRGSLREVSETRSRIGAGQSRGAWCGRPGLA
jgi:uncharacterized protein DUF3987